MFFCLESNLQKIKGNVRRMYQDIVNSHIEPTDPLSNLIVLRDYHNFSIQLYTVKYLPKNVKAKGMEWQCGREVSVSDSQSGGPGFYSRSWDLLDLFSVVPSSNPWPLVFNPVMLYLNYLFLLSI